MTMTLILITVAMIILSSSSVRSAIGNIQFSSHSGEAVTPGLTPPTPLFLLGRTLYRGESLWSVLFMLEAMYIRAFL